MNIKNYVVYGNDNYVLPSYFVNVESIEKTVSSFNGHIKPHVHSNLFQVIQFEQGKGRFISDQTSMNIAGPCIITIAESTLHEIQFDMQTEFKGKVLTINTSLLEDIFADLPKSLFRLTNGINFLERVDNFEECTLLIDKISTHLPENGPRTRLAINAYLSLFFLQLLKHDNLNSPTNKFIKKQSYLYFRSFEKEVKATQSIARSVAEYADSLKITPTHLNRICKANVGLTASQVIQNYIVLEIKRNLLYTSYTISEISHIFNFNDLGYFCRFFKKHTGKTPKSFRESQVTSQEEAN